MRSIAALALLVIAGAAGAQQAEPDSAISRALQLVANADTAGARRLLDSLSTRGATSVLRGEATYQLSRIAPSAADRELLLGTLIIDHQFSPRVPAALYELGMLELARNDRDRAVTHLSQYLTVAPADSGRLTAALTLGRLLVERGELPRGCAVLLVGRSELPETAIELRNQFEFSVGRCRGVDTSSKVDTRRVAAADTAPAQQRTGAFTVQVAAYDTKAAADRLATTLRGQGLAARVVGSEKPYRVRVGRYATRALAEEASRDVNRIAKSRSIVVVVGPEER